MEPDAPSSETASPQRKGILDFVQKLKAPKVEATPAPSASKEPLKDSGALHQHFAEFAWALQQNNWLKFSLLVHIALAILIWTGAIMAITRPSFLQVGTPTLKEAAEAFYNVDYNSVDPSLLFDQMSLFTISSLTLLHQLDAYSTPTSSLLKGLVAPEIVQKTQKRFEKNQKVIQKQNFVQNLIINRILKPITNPQTGTLAVFVEGYFAILLQDEDGSPVNRIEPYRAKAILRLTPVSKLNPFPFTLEDLSEVVGRENALKWDQENSKFFKQ